MDNNIQDNNLLLRDLQPAFKEFHSYQESLRQQFVDYKLGLLLCWQLVSMKLLIVVLLSFIIALFIHAARN